MTIKGFSSNQKRNEQSYLTLQNISGGKTAADTVPKAVYSIQDPNFVPTGGTTSSIVLAGHQASEGDLIRIVAGNNLGLELNVSSVTASEIFFDHVVDTAFSAVDEFKILKYITLTLTNEGSIAVNQGPIQILKDAVATEISKDTVDPNNTVALPVEIVAVDGTEINITAGDINVQTSHTGANPDSVQIGDGTETLGINASNEALTHDADVLAELLLQKALLTSLDGKDFSTSAKQDTVITSLANLLTELQAKADLTETQPVSAVALPLPTGAATEAKQDTAITALGNLLTELQAKADLTETQPVSAVALPLPTGAATEAKQDVMEVSLDAILAKIIAAPATEAKQDTIITNLGTLITNTALTEVVETVSPIDISVNNIPALGDATGLQLVASTASDIKRIQTVEDVGEYLGLYSGAPSSLVLEAILPIAGGEVEVSIPAGTRLSIKHLKASAISTSTFFAANLIG
jgi:ribosomal protein L7/L12